METQDRALRLDIRTMVAGNTQNEKIKKNKGNTSVSSMLFYPINKKKYGRKVKSHDKTNDTQMT